MHMCMGEAVYMHMCMGEAARTCGHGRANGLESIADLLGGGLADHVHLSEGAAQGEGCV